MSKMMLFRQKWRYQIEKYGENCRIRKPW